MRTTLLLLILTGLTACCGSATAPDEPVGTGAYRFAEPVERPGLPNLHRVDDGVWRGAQPKEAGVAELTKLGIRTVLNLRHGDEDEELLEGSGIDYVHVPMEAFDVDRDEVDAALAVLLDPARRPVFVHCRHGSDRTGLILALYRVEAQGWPREEAVREWPGRD